VTPRREILLRHQRGRIYDWQLPLEQGALGAAAELAAPSESDRLLDVATGTGGLLRELARRGRRPAEVVGVDNSASMLAIAAAEGLPAGWRVILGDARRLPFPDQRFDVVAACYLLHLMDRESRTRTIAEIARVTRPGGRVVIVTVESRRPAARSVLTRLPRRSGLRPLDPSRELRSKGLEPQRARFVRGGWPSLCVLALRRPAVAPILRSARGSDRQVENR
jgi:ubiquinone/menaquinone biosynthesis C-methylase UbiE